MSTSYRYDPDIEAEKGRGLTGEALANHWQRINGRIQFGNAPVSEALVEAAYLALDYWETCQQTTRCRREDGAIDSAFRVICELIREQEESADEHVLRMAAYFGSQNIVVAFTAVRQFEYRIPEHRHRVLDRLVELATAPDVPRSPVEMTLRGIAFLQLFLHDRRFATWPQLQRARDECIYGCCHWTFNDRNVSGARFAELGEEIASIG